MQGPPQRPQQGPPQAGPPQGNFAALAAKLAQGKKKQGPPMPMQAPPPPGARY